LGKVADVFGCVPFARNGQQAFRHRQQERFVRSCVADEGADRCQPSIPASNTIAPMLLEIIQEGQDTLCGQILNEQLIRVLAIPLFQEANEQLECVAVGADCVRAEVALADEILAEISLDG
jgi:hypothetical protein